MSVILTLEKDISILQKHFSENLLEDTIYILERSDLKFIDNNTFIINIGKLNLEVIKDLYYFDVCDGYYNKVATTEYNYIFALDGCWY